MSLTLRESLVTLIEFAREHGQHDDRLQRACKVAEKKAERLREKYEAQHAVVEIDAEAPLILGRSQILIDYRGEWCRPCNRKKAEHSAFCLNCWYRLNARTRKALQLRFGDGFEQAYEMALTELGKSPAAFTARVRASHE